MEPFSFLFYFCFVFFVCYFNALKHEVPCHFSCLGEFCSASCEALQMFCGLQNFTGFSIGVRGSTTEFFKRFLVDFFL